MMAVRSGAAPRAGGCSLLRGRWAAAAGARVAAAPTLRPVPVRCRAREVLAAKQAEDSTGSSSSTSTSSSGVVSRLLAPAAITAVANVLLALPAAAEPGKLFDFNLTLPGMAAEFLLLMVFLDKFWFGPVGKVLDERDATIRDQLASVKDNSSDLSKYTQEAEEVVRKARNEVSEEVSSKKNAKQAELDKIYNEKRDKINKETEAAVAELDKESEALLQKLDAQVDKISNEVLRRVLPEGVKV